MKFKLYLLIFLSWSVTSTIGQTFTNSTGGAIPDGGPEVCFPISVSGVGNINGTYGLASVCLNITHAYVEDLEIQLHAPDGTIVPLSIQNGGSGNNYTNTCFTQTAGTSITASSAPFSGSYQPEGDLGTVNNNQNANGVWTLCITDITTPDAGTLLNYSITFNNTPAPPTLPGPDDPCNALLLTVKNACNYIPFTNVGATASTGVPAPGCATYVDGDVWFKVVVPATGGFIIDTKDIVMTNSGMAIYKGTCSSLTLMTCNDNGSANPNMSLITTAGLNPGDTIWVRVWGRGTNNHGSFGICVTPNPPPPTPQDCPAALPICQNTYSEPFSYNGTGNLPNEINSANSCLNAGERADVWYTFTVQSSGFLNFVITPNTITEDYDWAVYNLTNNTCADIYNNPALSVSCNFSGTTGTTGPTGGSALNTQGSTGTPFNAQIPVTTGQTYVINVSNYSLSTHGYTIDFGASTAGIFDNVPPKIKTVTPANICGSNSLTVVFSENVLCSTVENTDFTVTGPGGPYTVTAVSSASCISGATYGNTYTLTVSPAMIPGGAYQVCLVPGNGIADLCGNVALPGCTNFSIKIKSASTTNVSICPSALPYSWNGNTYAAGGTYKDTLLNSVGCDSVVTLVLTIKPVSASTTNVSVCPSALPYSWNGNTYATGGAYKDTLLNSVGCDSVVTLVLTIKPVSASTTNVSVCPSALPYSWNGNTYATGGTYNDTLLNSVGCDSVVTLVLIEKNVSASTTNIGVCPSALPYLWNGNSYAIGGTYKDTLLNSVGCDSVVTLVLNIKLVSASTNNVSVCPSALPYTWNGNTYATGGTYKDTLLNSVGCDSVVTLVLTIKQVSASTTNVSVCPSALPYSWNGNIYATAGAYKDTLLNSVGCDSVATMVLTVNNVSASTTNIAVCPAQLPYSWNGNTYNAAGTFTKTLVNSVGCDFIATLVLAVKATSASTTNIAVCPSALPYSWNGNTYNAAGTFTKTLVNSVGCDSVATLVLTVNNVSASTTNIAVCPSVLPYLWNGNTYNAAGTFTNTLVNSVGCDSVATLVLTVNIVSASTTNIAVCPAQLPYSWNGVPHNTAGTYAVTLVNSVGCDSVATLVLTVNNVSASTTNIAICPAQLPYSWNGNTYNAAGTFTKTLVNSMGCDSVATLVLTVNNVSASTTNIAVCPAQLPYSWNGNTYNAAGTFTKTLVNSLGCDSVATLVLAVNTVSASTTNIAVCPAQLPYTWNGNTYATGGTYKDTLLNSVGCDSIATLVLTVKNVLNSTTNVAVCPSALPYTWNGNAYATGGTYKDTLLNSVGCDSVVTLVLTIKPVSASTTNVSVCPSALPYSWNSNIYATAGAYKDTLLNSVGCDSVVTLVLTIKPVSASTTNLSVCPSALPYSWNGNTYAAGGTYKDTLLNSVGCDSVAVLVLTVKNVSASTTNIAVCPSALPYSWNGNTYTTGGTYKDTLLNSVGCDSVVTLVLTVKSVSASTTNIGVCPSALPYSWNGNIYATGGTYKDTLLNSVGCDSVVTLVLTVKPVSPSTTNIAVCPAALPYSWNGNTYAAGGTFKDTLLNSVGCDSVAMLVLTVKNVSASTTNIAVCPAALPYSWNGNTYNAAGTFTKTLVNSVGCDSVATLVLAVKATSSSTTNIAVCPATLPYSWNGNTYAAGGTYKDTLLNSVGCDSVVTLVLIEKNVSASTTNIGVCPSALPYTWNGNAYNTGGTYKDTLLNSVGCDSVVTLVLIEKNVSASTTSIAVCPAALPYLWNGNTYATGGIYKDTLLNSVGCDSVVTLVLIEKNVSASTTNIGVCPSALPYTWNGNAYNTGGTYKDTLLNSVGCDSVVTLVLIEKNVSASTTNIGVCPSALPYTWNGNSYAIGGTYKDTLLNSVGCDSVVTLVLTIKPVSASTNNVSVCPSALPYSWNGNTYVAGGTYKDTLLNSVGCDSVVTLVLTEKNVSASTTNIGVCPLALPYTWNGNAYNTGGTFKDTLLNSVGCDSVVTLVLTIKLVSASTTNVSICPSALPYSWNGNSYNAAGTFTKTLVNGVGCDSTVTLVFVVKATSASTTNIAVCPGQLPYTWNGVLHNTAGTYSATLTNSVGCDSIATLVLAVKATSSSTTNIAICPAQLPYNWNGVSHNTGGTYAATLINSVGCDSIATLVLAVKATSSSTTNIAVCPAALPYLWNGNTYATGGTYKDTSLNSVGCDSIATLVLTVKNVLNSTTNVAVCPSALPYTWNGNAYATGGTYKDTLLNSVSCDSVVTLVLTVKPVSASTTNIAVCPAALPYSWNGNTYITGGTYKDTLVNSMGCDSVVTLVLTIKPFSASTTNVSVCPSAFPYSWNGNTYTAGGTFKDTLLNSVGCDSVVTLVLTIKPVSASTTNVSVCPSALPYSWNGNTYTTAGTYKDTLLNSVGCDSVVTLVLNIKPVSASTTNLSVCPSALPYTWNGNAYAAGGTYKDTLLNSVGCDSVVTLVLTIKPASASTTNVSVCPSALPYLWNGNSYAIGGTYKDTLLNSVGCDSVVTMVLTVKPVSASTTNIAVCPAALPYSWNGNTYITGGTYKDTLVNSVGCDSVVTLVLTIKPVSTSTTNVSVCPSALPYSWNGNTYSAGGAYKDTLLNSVGCDSVVTLVLTIKPVSASTTNVSVCPSALPYKWNGNAYNTGGTYKDTLLNSVGCDSVVTLVLTVKPVSASTTNIAVCPAQLPYSWNGNTYNAAGTFTKTLVNSVGCDSIATLVFVVKATSASTTNIAVCPAQLPYSWNGNTYNAAGTFTKTLVNSVGCDSIATLVFVVKATSASTTNIAVCPAQLPYLWNGNTYNAAGTFTKKLVNSVGCDSIATLVLAVNPTVTSITNKTICSAALPFTWNNNQYNAPGLYTVVLKNTAGCDSITKLILTVNTTPGTPTTTSNSPLCSGQTLTLSANAVNGISYQWTAPSGGVMNVQNPTFYNTSVVQDGLYSVTASANGCTSLPAKLTVSIIQTPVVSAGLDMEVYEGDTAKLMAVASGTNLSYEWTPNLYFISPDTVKNPLLYGVHETTYSLTVTQSGFCAATDKIIVKVLPRLKPIYIPNVFSPNNDGVNDVWVIRALAAYPEATVDVFTRYGQNVYSSAGGYRHPWDGTYNGKKMPDGVYYYIITTNKKSKPYTGWVTILK